MQLFHTSPSLISSVTANGRFGERLFFAQDKYYRLADSKFVYSIELEENRVVRRSSLFYRSDCDLLQSFVSALADRYSFSVDTIEGLLDGSISAYDVESSDAGELDWDFQIHAAEAAELLGFSAVELRDEHGTSFLVNMRGLALQKVETEEEED